MRLQAAGFRALHVLADSSYAACVHDVVNEDVFFEEFLELMHVQGILDDPD